MAAGPQIGDYAIEFHNVSRRFVLHHERRSSFQDWFIGLIRPRGSAEEFWALRDVSFNVRRGETIGIIGRNGAGKSTLLKLVTRILEPSSGSVRVNGRTYAMLELGAGFHPELSGRDNIYLNGSLYGFSRREMRQKFDEIVRFAELERFIDTPVKHYSSGMYARLGFGIAVHMQPEILVIDEVLAVGDANFQAKCYRALAGLKRRGTTILFVSHDSDAVRDFCDRAALLVDGMLVDIGPANDVVDHYERLLAEREPEVSLLRVRAIDRLGLPTEELHSSDDLRFEVLLRAPNGSSTGNLWLQIDLLDEPGNHLFTTSTPLPPELPAATLASQRGDDEPDTRVASGVIRHVPVHAGPLHLLATLLAPGEANQAMDRQETTLQVIAPESTGRALLALGHTWSWQEPKTEAEPVEQQRRSPVGFGR
jgi:ABC-type polysaccharide/polyol phosphate transport system ATPase subunit